MSSAPVVNRGFRFLSKVNLLGLATLAGFVGLWQVLVSGKVVHYQFLPAPSAIWTAGKGLISNGELPESVVHTVSVTLIAWVLASLFGVIVGSVIGLSRTTWKWVMATIELLRAIPSISFVPVALLVFGFSSKMEIVIAVYVAQWPVLINTIDAVRNVHNGLRDTAKTLHLSFPARMWKVVLPAATPTIVVGLRLALTLSLILAVVAEMIGNPTGLGYQLVFQQQALQPAKMFAYVITIGLLGVILNGLFMLLVRWLPGARQEARP